MAFFIIISVVVLFESSFDTYHEKARRIYRVAEYINDEGVVERSSSCPFPLGPTVKQEYPDVVENYVRFFNDWTISFVISYEEDNFIENGVFFVDSTIFDIFDLNFIAGNPKYALSEPNTVIITESIAKKFFGLDNTVGKQITVKVTPRIPRDESWDDKINFVITGVIEDAPKNSHLQYNLLTSFETLNSDYFDGRVPETWGYNPCWTYLLLHDKAKPQFLEKKFPEFIKKYITTSPNLYEFDLQPITDIHLKSDLEYDMSKLGDYNLIRILSIIAIILLIIISTNYINLTTTNSTQRNKEIGIKKIYGSAKATLFKQFIFESITLTYISIIFSLLIVVLLLPLINKYMDFNVDFKFILRPSIVIYLIISGALVGLFSGAYSAFYLSNISILDILKGTIKVGGKARFRKALVIIQFVICLVLITCSVLVINQVQYLNNAEIGIRKDNILIVPLEGTDIPNNFESFRDKLMRNPDIISVTGMMFVPGINYSTADFKPESNKSNNTKLLNFNIVKHSFTETFGIDIIAGRTFSEAFKTDENEAVIINEAMVRYLGWTNKSAIGKKFYFDGREKVIGVMKDFHIGSLREAIKPIAITMVGHQNVAKVYTRFSAIRIKDYNDTETISFIEEVWDEMKSSTPFTYTHFDDDLKNLYSNEVKILRLGIFFTIVSVILAVMGVNVLIVTITNMQKREIGIRKALGANKTQIILMYMKKHFSQLALAALIASPISHFLIKKWFENYALKIPINAFPFIISFIILTSMSSLVVFLQTNKASDANPVDSIKTE